MGQKYDAEYKADVLKLADGIGVSAACQQLGNIMQIWRDGEADKLTQLVFCDISTPQAAPSKKAAKQLDNPTLHALEQAVPLDEPEPAFTIYEDIRQKLIAQGMPAEQIAFIHEAKTEVQKKELFSKVRTGQVRVLLGSTSKMGAGTNVQDRLVALHDLDCPWRPGDLAQRKGRIERQGNQNPLVHVYRYVTEGTFDAYLWQTVENKQKFISQIMTSKSPVRSCDDVDETALSFAEIKALCAGDPRIKERMDLDVEVARLKLMKADHQSKQYRLEDQLLKYFPQEIETNKGFIKGFEADLETLATHPHPEDGFAGMEIRGDVLTDKENAGAALLDACKEVKGSEPVQIGSYRGFTNASIFVNKELQRVTRGALDDLSDKGVIKKFPPCIASTHTALVLKEPKTKTSIRRVYLPKTVAKMLVDRKAEIDELKDLFGDEYIDNDLVFCTSNGRPMESQIINRAFNKLIKENGFPHVVFHSLRHSSITYKLKLNGGDMKAVQGDSGHAQMKMVADVYSHIIDEDRCINAQRFEDAFYSQAKAPEPAIQEIEEKETGTTTPESDTAKILELLKNPETAALLKQIVSAL